MKTYIFFTCFLISLKIYPQFLFDTAYFKVDDKSRYYVPKINILYSELINNNNEYLNFIYGEDAKEKSAFTDEAGIKHHHFLQYKSGVPILNSDFYIRENNNYVMSATGFRCNNIQFPNQLLEPRNCTESLLKTLKCYKYRWLDPMSEEALQSEMNDATATYYPKPVLQIIQQNSNSGIGTIDYKLVYCISISAMYYSTDSNYVDSVYLVDAKENTIIKRYSPKLSCFHKDILKNFNNSEYSCASDCNSASPQIHYYGSQTIYTEKFRYSGICTHRLKDNCTNTYLYVKQYSNGNDVDFRNVNNNWLASGNPSDKIGATALWCIEQSHDFFRYWLGRNSYDNSYSQIKAIVGSTTNIRTGWNLIHNFMDIGRFNGGASYETTLDILAHEIGHGVTDNICNMAQDGSISNDNEEMALAEGYSDIFGQGTEHYVANNVSSFTGTLDDFLQGSNLPLTTNKQRDLSNPSNTGNPDTYQGTNWLFASNSSASANHRNCTVLGFWYYLLSNGGSGNNDFNNSFCVSGIGQYKSLQIAYNSLFYLGGTSKQFTDARNATIQSATNLFGTNSNEVAQVTAAWYAVGVGTNYTGQIDIKNHIATGIENYTQWNSKVEMSNFDANSGSNVTTTSNREVSIQPNTAIINGAIFNAFIQPACIGGARIGNSVPIENADVSNDVKLEVYNKANSNTDLSIQIVPNPSEGVFKLLYNEDQDFPNRISVSNLFGEIIFEQDINVKADFTIDLRNMAKGIYNAKIIYKDHTLSKKLIKN